MRLVVPHLTAIVVVLALAAPAGAGPTAFGQPTNGEDAPRSGRQPQAARQVAAGASARQAAAADPISPILTPMAREVKVVVDSTSVVLDSLRTELTAAAAEQAYDLRAEIARVLAAADLRILQIQCRHARQQGRTALARQIELAIARCERMRRR
jgi:hypothetical protein